MGQDIKSDFPIFGNNPDLVFLDSGASSQKPQAVINAMRDCYEQYYANIHRGIYQLSERSSEAYEGVREKVRRFIHAPSASEIVFTRNTTEGINLIAYCTAPSLHAGDEIVLTEMEHHANLVPWQQLCQRTGAVLKYAPVRENGRLDKEAFEALLNDRTKVVAFTHMSNVLGTINPVRDMVQAVRHRSQALVVIDGAQSVPHFRVDVQDIDADLYVFSAHKMLGPGGVGVLYGKRTILDSWEPFLTGGDMITSVTKDSADWNEVPHKFEAGTPNIAGVIGLGAAIDYLESLGMDTVFEHEKELTAQALGSLRDITDLNIVGPTSVEERGGAVAFTVEDIHPHDIASVLDEHSIAVRAGNHCAQPLHIRLGVPATIRASFYVYNTKEDIASLCDGINKAKKLFT